MDRPQPKLLGLEILRFVCALAVVLYHYHHFAAFQGASGLHLAQYPLSELLGPVYRWGQLGVQFFWMISGFVFFWKYGEVIAAHRIAPRKFFWLRFSRLYPLHLATLLIVASLQPVHALLTGHDFVFGPNNASQFALNLAMATQWGTMAPMTFDGPFWSVSAEVLVYAIFFAVVWRFGSSIATCAAVMLIGLGISFAASPVAFCALMFFAGGLTALLFAERGHRPAAPTVALGLLLVAMAVIAAAMLSGVDLAPRMLALGVGPQLMFLAARDWRLFDRFARPIEIAGNLTYSTYLCHFPMQLALAVVVAATGIVLPLSSPVFLAAYVGGVLLVGYLVFERFERPAQDWIRAGMLRRVPSTSVTRPA